LALGGGKTTENFEMENGIGEEERGVKVRRTMKSR